MIGKRRQRVTIQKNTPTRVKGVRTDVWGDVDEVYAEIKTLGGRERRNADQNEMVTTHEIRMRYRASVSDVLEFIAGGVFEFIAGGSFEFLFGDTEPLARYRIKFGSKYFEVRSVLHPDPRRETTVMRVEEVVT